MKISKKTVSRATALSLGVAVMAGPTVALADTTATAGGSEQAQLRALYRKAKAEGGKVTVYMGGDAPGQWDSLAKAFTAQFPDVKLHLVTDLSKYHDRRIDRQIAARNPVADVAILQTTQDFDRWKRQGALLKYKPVGYNKVFRNAKDADGYWTGVFYGAFSYIVNTKRLPATPSSFKGTALLGPQYKGKLILTYPNDDDAVLFGYKQIVRRYGWSYLRKLVGQKPTYVRGVPGSAAGVASGKYLATIAAGGDARPNGSQVFSAGERFNSWAQRGAILKQSKHKATAKLFLSWLNSRAVQKNAIATWTWSVRSDVAPPTGLKPLATYKNTNPDAFAKFMSDRRAVARFRVKVQHYTGPVKGADPVDPNGTLGPNPGGF